MGRTRKGHSREGSTQAAPVAGSDRWGALLPAAAIGLFALLAGGIWLGFGLPEGSQHPDPRPGITGATVIPASRYIQYARVSAVYTQAAEIASTLDGLYCHCDCSKHSDHRSLLTCFESDHGAACDICLTEAAIAYRMTKNGRTLDEIRTAIDELYGS